MVVFDVDATNVDDVVNAILVPISSNIGSGYSAHLKLSLESISMGNCVHALE